MSVFKIVKAPERVWSRKGGVLTPVAPSYQKAAAVPAPNKKSVSPLVGKTVFFRRGADSQMIAGVVSKLEGSTATVKLCLPNTDGVLVMSQGSELSVPEHSLMVVDAIVLKDRDVKAYSEAAPITVTSKAVAVVDSDEENGRICDYQDVTFSGMASTFQNVTPEDRDGDYILPTAFGKWLNEFRRNPVLLTDHSRSVKNLMGHYPKVNVIANKGLAVDGFVTNSPHPDAKHLRFQLVEKSLKTLSIGGSFFYMDDMRGIEEIRLHEISLVVIPANPDAEIVTLALTGEHAEKAFQMHTSQHGGEVRAGIKMKNLS
jgi:HK97 family phage prohead protease